MFFSPSSSGQEQQPGKLLDPALLSKIKDYRLLARLAANGFLTGPHRSLISGQGSEFLQYREYVRGDDFKSVDWKLFARSDRLQTKRFAEQAQATCYLLVDTSASMSYKGSRSPASKLHYACMLAAALAWLAVHQGDRVSLMTYSDKVHDWLPPAGLSAQLNHLLLTLSRLKPNGSADHPAAIELLMNRLSDRGMIILLSDMTEAGNLPELFKFNTGQTHAGMALQILDPDELDFPFTGSTLFEDLENGQQIQTNPAAIRTKYIQGMQASQKSLQARFNQSRIDFFSATNDMDLALVLSRYFHQRKVID
ncbi:MAG: DUF58 domain-containing protein [Gammaproteobacteria bacterium]|nr:DUF58 domain-containing protein [Gammaproteobacteria bacterium]